MKKFQPHFNVLLLLAGITIHTSAIASEGQNTNIENTPFISEEYAKDANKALKNPNSALVSMAFKFKHTEGSPKGYAEVVASYCSAAKSGDADAQYALGWMYSNGRGVVADKSIAAQLYAKAASQGHARAQEALASLSDLSPASDLPTCLLPDLPKPIATITLPQISAMTEPAERKTITPQTAALFKSQRDIFKIVKKLAPKYKIDAELAMSFIAVESAFDVFATSPKNAQGLMQLIPETAERFGVKDAYRAEDNIKGGLAYLQWLLAYFKGDVELVAAAYNAGEGTVEKYKGVPPYAETQLYVKRIAKLYNNDTHPYKDNLVKAPTFMSTYQKKIM